MRLLPLNGLRAFEAAARHLSFKKAAKELLVTPAAISYQVQNLEEFIGVNLFIRKNRSIQLSSAGKRCLIDIKSGFTQIDRGITKAQEKPNSNILTICADPAFIIKWLAPRLHDFIKKHPSIEPRISSKLTNHGLNDNSSDTSILFGPINNENLYVEKIITDTLIPLCNPSLLKGEHGLTNPNNIRHHNLIHDDSLSHIDLLPKWNDCLQKVNIKNIDTSRGIRFDQADHAIQAAIDGIGIVFTRRTLTMSDIKEGRLVSPLPNSELPTDIYYHIACLKEKSEEYKIQAFMTWMKLQSWT